MNKKRLIVWGSVIGAILLLAGGAFAVRGNHYSTRFLPNTTVLGVNVGGDSVKAANAKLKARFAKVTYKVTDGKTAVATLTGPELGLKRDFTAPLKGLLKKQNPWGFSAVVLAGSDKNDFLAVNGKNEIKTKSAALATELNKKRTAPTDAQVVYEDGKYTVQKEQPGNQVDAAKFATALTQTVQQNKSSVDLAGTYVEPKVVSTDKKLTTAVSKLEKMASIKGTITIENQSVTIDKDTLAGWLSYANGEVQVSEDGVAAFVNKLAAQYNTIDKTRTFKSTKQGTVNVRPGSYGWSIAPAAETKALIDLIKKGKDFTQEVIHRGSGYKAGGGDIGNTYIEVDLKNQHEWYYENGVLKLETPVVTGKPATPTPSGVFYVWSKSRNATLVGEDYRTPVSYWMPIDYTGVGLHDANWQPKFGGDWFLAHGSHGCVNNPPAFIAQLYNAVAVGTPVIVIN